MQKHQPPPHCGCLVLTSRVHTAGTGGEKLPHTHTVIFSYKDVLGQLVTNAIPSYQVKISRYIFHKLTLQTKVRILGYVFTNEPFKRERGAASDIREKVLHQPRRGNGLLQKKKWPSLQKPPALYQRPGGGGGRYMGRTQPNNLKLLHFHIYIYI